MNRSAFSTRYCGGPKTRSREASVSVNTVGQYPSIPLDLTDPVKVVKEEAGRRDEKYHQLAEAEKNKSKVLEAKFQELFKKAKEEPLEKPLKDIDLD